MISLCADTQPHSVVTFLPRRVISRSKYDRGPGTKPPADMHCHVRAQQACMGTPAFGQALSHPCSSCSLFCSSCAARSWQSCSLRCSQSHAARPTSCRSLRLLSFLTTSSRAVILADPSSRARRTCCSYCARSPSAALRASWSCFRASRLAASASSSLACRAWSWAEGATRQRRRHP